MPFFKTHKFNFLILILLTFLAYINIYQNEFLSDDIPSIVKNKTLGDLAYNLKTLSVPDTILSLNFIAGGLNPWVYHLTNVLFHTANVILIYFLVYLVALSFRSNFFTPQELGFATSALFATHPIHTEVVTWISGRPYAIYSFFVLVSLISIVYLATKSKVANNQKIVFFTISEVSYILALLVGERAVMFPLLLIMVLFIIKRTKSFLFPIILSIITTALFGIIFIQRFLARVETVSPHFEGLGVIRNPLIQIPVAMGTYLELLFAPINLTLYRESIVYLGEFIFLVITTLLFLVATFFFFKKSKILFFAFAFLLIATFPHLIPVKIVWLTAERYIYLGSLGFCLFLAYMIYKIGHLFKSPPLPIVLLSTIIVTYMLLTWNRNRDWASEDTLWPATVKVSPRIPMAHNNMGDYYMRRGNLDEAIAEFSTAIELNLGDYPEALHNLGNAYLRKNEATLAAQVYEKAISQKPNQIESFIQLASISISQKDYPKAEGYLNEAVKINPNYSPVYNSLGVIAFLKGDKIKAKELLEHALSLDPDNSLAKNNLSRLQQ